MLDRLFVLLTPLIVVLALIYSIILIPYGLINPEWHSQKLRIKKVEEEDEE